MVVFLVIFLCIVKFSSDIDMFIVYLCFVQDYGSDSFCILMLINDLVCIYEDLFEVFEGDLFEQGGWQLGMICILYE